MRVNLYTDVIASDAKTCRLSITTNSGSIDLDRLEAIKLRNYLNEFINGNLEETEDEE